MGRGVRQSKLDQLPGGKHVLVDLDGVPAKIDNSSISLQVIDFQHHEIHEGDHYFVNGTATLDQDDTLDFAVQTPDSTTWAHMLFKISSTEQTTFQIFETSDYDADGSRVTAYNNDRNSSNTSILTITKDPTVNSNGTLLFEQSFGVTSTPTRSLSGETRADEEIILKQNTKYIFRITSAANDNIVSYDGKWYEHANEM